MGLTVNRTVNNTVTRGRRLSVFAVPVLGAVLWAFAGATPVQAAGDTPTRANELPPYLDDAVVGSGDAAAWVRAASAWLGAQPDAPSTEVLLRLLDGDSVPPDSRAVLASALDAWLAASHDNGLALDLARGLRADLYRAEGKPAESLAIENQRCYAKDWLVVGPFGPPRAERLDLVFEPEAELARPGPDVARRYREGWRELRLLPLSADPHYTSVMPGRPLGAHDGVLYCVAQARLAEAREALVDLAVGGACALWVNGREVGRWNPGTSPQPDERRVPVRLDEGWNRLVLKLDGALSFSLRLADPSGRSLEAVAWERSSLLYPLPAQAAPAPAAAAASCGAESALRARLESADVSWADQAALALLLDDLGLGTEAMHLALDAANAAGSSVTWALYAGLVEGNPDYPDNWKRNRSRGAYRKALAVDEACVPAVLGLAGQLASDDKLEDAVRMLRRLVQARPATVEALLDLENLYWRHGWLAEARELRGKLRQDFPRDLRALGRLADRHRADGDLPGAMALWKAMLELDRFGYSVRMSYADALSASGDTEAALAVWKAYAEHDPQDPNVAWRTARYLEQAGRWQEAMDLHRGWALKGPQDARYPRKAAALLRLSGDRARVADRLADTLRLSPGDSASRRWAAFLTGVADDPAVEYDRAVEPLIEGAPGAQEYPRAPAVCLYDLAVLRFNEDGSRTEVVHQAFKLLNEDGKRSFEALHLGQEPGIVHTLAPDGRVLEPISTDESRAFVMPGLTEGAVVEYRYRNEVPGGGLQVMGNRFFFRSPSLEVPNLRSVYVVDAPRSMDLRWISRRMDMEPVVSTRGERRIWRWEAVDQPTVKQEPLMPDVDEVQPWVRFYTPATWREVAAQYRSDLSGRLDPSPELEAAVREATEGVEGARARAEALYRYAADRVRTPGGGYSATEILMERSGDRLVLLAGLLNAAGIPWSYARAAGDPRLHPVKDAEIIRPEMFGVPLLRVEPDDGAPVWVSSAVRLAPFGRLPEELAGGRVFVLSGASGVIERLPSEPPQDRGPDLRTTLTLEPDGGAKLSLRFRMGGSSGFGAKEYVAEAEAFQVKTIVESIVNQLFPGAVVKDFRLPGKDDPQEPLTLSVRCTLDRYVEPLGDGQGVRPGISPLNLSESLVGDAERVHPLVLRQTVVLQDSQRLRLGEGWRLRSLPPSTVLYRPWGSYSLSFEGVGGDEVQVERRVDLGPLDLSPAQYADLIEFCKTVDRVEAQRIGVVKHE